MPVRDRSPRTWDPVVGAGRTCPLQPQGGAQQAMVLSCESVAKQRHAGGPREDGIGNVRDGATGDRARQAYFGPDGGARRGPWVMMHTSSRTQRVDKGVDKCFGRMSKGR